MDVSLEIMEACLGKIEVSQGKVEIKMEACLKRWKWRLPGHRRTDMGNGVWL
jgi:hypothetical protein